MQTFASPHIGMTASHFAPPLALLAIATAGCNWR